MTVQGLAPYGARTPVPSKLAGEVAEFEDHVLTRSRSGRWRCCWSSDVIGRHDDNGKAYLSSVFEFLDDRMSATGLLAENDGLKSKLPNEPSDFMQRCTIAPVNNKDLVAANGGADMIRSGQRFAISSSAQVCGDLGGPNTQIAQISRISQ